MNNINGIHIRGDNSFGDVVISGNTITDLPQVEHLPMEGNLDVALVSPTSIRLIASAGAHSQELILSFDAARTLRDILTKLLSDQFPMEGE